MQHDRQLEVYADFDTKLRERIKVLISPDLIEEHAANPLGHHSDSLARVLNYFRRQPQAGKYIIVATRPWEEYRIGVLSGIRGEPATILEGPTFGSEDEALHGIFLRRVDDLMES